LTGANHGQQKIASVLIATTLLASAAVVSTPAMAHDRGGNGVAIAAGIIGAVAIGSLIANAQFRTGLPGPAATGLLPGPQPVYYQPPQQVVYEQPRYYAPPPPRPVRYGAHRSAHLSLRRPSGLLLLLRPLRLAEDQLSGAAGHPAQAILRNGQARRPFFVGAYKTARRAKRQGANKQSVR
jgi:hypothetical protein